MIEFIEELQQILIYGMLCGFCLRFALAGRKSWVRNIWLICLLLYIACFVILEYYAEISVFFSRLFTWLGWGALALVAAVVGFRVIRQFLFGKRV